MWPDHETKTDLINYAGIAVAITQVIREPHLTPLTIGIHGEWGSGKSSVMSMVREQVAEDAVICVSFNGWAFEGFEDAKLALMESLVDALHRNERVTQKAQTIVVDLAKRVNYFKIAKIAQKVGTLYLASHGLPIDIETALKPIEEFLKAKSDSSKETKPKDELTVKVDGDDPWIRSATETAQHIHGFRTQLEKLLAVSEAKRLIVFIDDLDRCLPETVIETLEAIKLFLSVQGTTFVLCADDKFIEYAVERHFAGIPTTSGPGTTSSNYLEKLIQIPFRLPKLNRAETRRYVSLLLLEAALRDAPDRFDTLLASLAEAQKRPWEEVNLRDVIATAALQSYHAALLKQLELADQISAPLQDIASGNPRLLKRFLNTIMLRKRIATAFGLNEIVDDGTLAKLLLIERFASDVYEAIVNEASSRGDGRATFIAKLEEADIDVTSREFPSVGGIPDALTADENRIPWLLRWLKSGSRLGALDLRPYLYVSRESSVDFSAGLSLDAAAVAIAKTLMQSDSFVAAGLTRELQVLTRDQQRQVVDMLWESGTRNGFRDLRPVELENLNLVTSLNEALQGYVLDKFRAIPLDDVKQWMPSFLVRVAKHPSHRATLDSILTGWRKSSNKNVQSAVAFVAGSG
jgi:predicted KAP-like P-loop ATPase